MFFSSLESSPEVQKSSLDIHIHIFDWFEFEFKPVFGSRQGLNYGKQLYFRNWDFENQILCLTARLETSYHTEKNWPNQCDFTKIPVFPFLIWMKKTSFISNSLNKNKKSFKFNLSFVIVMCITWPNFCRHRFFFRCWFIYFRFHIFFVPLFICTFILNRLNKNNYKKQYSYSI